MNPLGEKPQPFLQPQLWYTASICNTDIETNWYDSMALFSLVLVTYSWIHGSTWICLASIKLPAKMGNPAMNCISCCQEFIRKTGYCPSHIPLHSLHPLICTMDILPCTLRTWLSSSFQLQLPKTAKASRIGAKRTESHKVFLII